MQHGAWPGEAGDFSSSTLAPGEADEFSISPLPPRSARWLCVVHFEHPLVRLRDIWS